MPIAELPRTQRPDTTHPTRRIDEPCYDASLRQLDGGDYHRQSGRHGEVTGNHQEAGRKRRSEENPNGRLRVHGILQGLRREYRRALARRAAEIRSCRLKSGGTPGGVRLTSFFELKARLSTDKLSHTPPDWFRGAEIIFGLVSVLISMVIILNPGYGNETLVLLLSLGLFFNAVRMISSGGVGHLSRNFRGMGLIGGALVVAIVALGFFSPGLGISTLISLLASGLIVQGAARLANVAHAGHPRWLRVSALTVGSLTVVLASVTLLEPNLALVSLVALLTIVLLINGFESIVSGVRPSSRKQLTLLKLIVFAIFYGFVNINWIDLFATSAPGYHIWLILTYMAPFGVLLVLQGRKDVQLAPRR